ncbi:pyroglutamyl-peptidase I [Virgibacillus pantothenticus]|uniref:pyroglutamyl-peptidase I n=1 Tax=Virgibacillus pantothenticus TaxID=1473 RepID=UPI001C2402F4|nr:pyroglutamyl-peptidase I [Virgibacillus pantothenticus]MBU8566235.1 pyroglutamyl-peptidase I [Virgibacillus pantothenticus]MBU8600660.1 pyroglutamyl-peptidase I [Virgibacillus pantothenticus]MBU8634632.1 pyroglutamyl-peptidase I [Virgibacillus pantothenticus]MBU8640765.1 pyroglutamyl-peptidase I [Virgibacillus pantothenticus]MBU8646480.1 pyroglutamyl-peptidase I [Virgibacillus pantothenticus]
MKKVLLTGFSAFLDNPINPTEEIAEKLDGEKIQDHEVVGRKLPVAFMQAGKQLISYIEEIEPDAIISLGLAAGRTAITPERIAINCNDGPKDNSGYQPNGEVIVDDGADGYFSTLPLQEIIATLHAEKLPAKVSNTAGTYVCNNVMYHALHFVKKQNLPTPAGFIHLPASHELALKKELPSWSQFDLINAVKIIIASL